MRDFDDLLDLDELDDITLMRNGTPVTFTLLEGFFHPDGERYFMMLLKKQPFDPNREGTVCGCIFTRKSWPCCRTPNTEEEWALVEEHFRLFQDKVHYALQHLEDEDDEDIPY